MPETIINVPCKVSYDEVVISMKNETANIELITQPVEGGIPTPQSRTRKKVKISSATIEALKIEIEAALQPSP